MAAGTGIRANALANLTPADFDLNGAPAVTVAARYAKNGRTKVQPLPADVAAALRDYIDRKPKRSDLGRDVGKRTTWGGNAANRPGSRRHRLRRRRPDGPEYADFHRLRHSYLTLGGRSGIDLRTLQELAGHSKPELTARYSHRRLNDLAGAVDKLPNLVPPTPDATEIPLRMTGTDPSKSVVPGVVPGVVTGGAERHQSALVYTSGPIDEKTGESAQVLEMKGAGDVCTGPH